MITTPELTRALSAHDCHECKAHNVYVCRAMGDLHTVAQKAARRPSDRNVSAINAAKAARDNARANALQHLAAAHEDVTA